MLIQAESEISDLQPEASVEAGLNRGNLVEKDSTLETIDSSLHLELPVEPMSSIINQVTPASRPIEAEAIPAKPSHFNLFKLLPREQQDPPNPEKPIVLDPSQAYAPPSGYITIASEVDWMRNFEFNGSPYWVKGKALCEWAEEWLRCWNRSYLIAEVKQTPREKLANLLESANIPNYWTELQCFAVVTHLEKYNTSDPISYLLADITESDLQVWLAQPSIKNLAQWLTIQVSEEALPLEQAWQAKRPNSLLNAYYQTTNKLYLLKQWLGIAEPHLADLGTYPFDIPPSLQAEFDHFWELELYRTNCGILDNLNFATQSAPQRIATKAYEILKQHPEYITTAREQKIKVYIGYYQYQDLTQSRQPPEPQPLSLDASANEALSWVTEAYLPLRRWETTEANLPIEKQACDRLASSFEDWILKHYPNLIVDPVPSSWLNYNVCHRVQELCIEGPVFWVVVDGLGWLDHQALLALLTENQQLKLEHGLNPRFSILPTKTEYAKWSLYSQRHPGHESWEPDAGKGFTDTSGKRYTDNDVTKSRLQKDLKAGNQRLYCWDTDRFDSLFHKEVDWHELYTVKRQRVLRDIACDILRFVDMYPQKDEVRVVIASDHGQLMGISAKLAHIPEGLHPKGRMAVGCVGNSQLSILDKDRFGLPHDISVIRGSNSFSSFSYADDKSIVGCHGGLYPEEVVIGFSVLKCSIKRTPIIVKCSGSGRPKEAHTLTIEIHNSNPLVIEDLKIFVEQLEPLQAGQSLADIVEANKQQTIEIQIPSWPELPPSYDGKSLSLTGKLEFRYKNAELGSVALDPSSAIEVNQIFSSGIEGLDDFF